MGAGPDQTRPGGAAAAWRTLEIMACIGLNQRRFGGKQNGDTDCIDIAFSTGVIYGLIGHDIIGTRNPTTTTTTTTSTTSTTVCLGSIPLRTVARSFARIEKGSPARLRLRLRLRHALALVRAQAQAQHRLRHRLRLRLRLRHAGTQAHGHAGTQAEKHKNGMLYI